MCGFSKIAALNSVSCVGLGLTSMVVFWSCQRLPRERTVFYSLPLAVNDDMSLEGNHGSFSWIQRFPRRPTLTKVI